MTSDPLILDLGLGDTIVHVPANPLLPTRKLLEPVPNEPNSYVLAIDNSSLENFNVCSRLAEYYMVHSREPALPGSALSLGSALHKGLEIIYRNGINDESIRLAHEVITLHFYSNPPPPDEYRNLSYCLDVFNGYLTAHPVELFSILHDDQGPWVERSFRLPLGALELNKIVPYKASEIVVPHDASKGYGWYPMENAAGLLIGKIYILWTGRLDLLIQWDGKYWVLDHKTTSRGGESFYEDFHMSQPQIGYTWAAQQLTKLPIAGTVINAFETRKPTKTGMGVVYNRRRYEYPLEQIQEWEHNTLTLVTDFLHHLARGFFPMETKWCFGKYGKCKYFDVCRLPPAQRMSALSFDSFRNVTWSPENPTE